MQERGRVERFCIVHGWVVGTACLIIIDTTGHRALKLHDVYNDITTYIIGWLDKLVGCRI